MLRLPTASSRAIVASIPSRFVQSRIPIRFLTTASDSSSPVTSIPPPPPSTAAAPLVRKFDTSEPATTRRRKPNPAKRPFTPWQNHPPTKKLKDADAVGSYIVPRTASSNLPIYVMRKRGGNLVFTNVRKIEGDSYGLQLDLVEALAVPPDTVVVNPVNGHVAVKVSAVLLQRRRTIAAALAAPPRDLTNAIIG